VCVCGIKNRLIDAFFSLPERARASEAGEMTLVISLCRSLARQTGEQLTIIKTC
jgi:hypothetical protein